MMARLAPIDPLAIQREPATSRHAEEATELLRAGSNARTEITGSCVLEWVATR
jgi:hypothetical protein